jgi:hypothetical protein
MASVELFDGKPISDVWQRMKITLFDEYEGLKLDLHDMLFFLFAPAFNEKAMRALYPVISQAGELLPATVGSTTYQVLNVTRFIDCLDRRRTNALFSMHDLISEYRTLVFREELLTGQYIFKVPQLPKTNVFVTNAFVDLVGKHNLTGLEFEDKRYIVATPS